MATRISCEVGFAEVTQTSPGVYEEIIHYRKYKGDLYRYAHRVSESNSVNGQITLNNTLQLVGDNYIFDHLGYIRCAKLYIGGIPQSWEVTNVEIQERRIILTIGGIYVGENKG